MATTGRDEVEIGQRFGRLVVVEDLAERLRREQIERVRALKASA